MKTQVKFVQLIWFKNITSFKRFAYIGKKMQTKHDPYGFFSEARELRLWPTEMPRARTQFRNLCRDELKNNKHFHDFLTKIKFQPMEQAHRFREFGTYYWCMLLENKVLMNYEGKKFLVICLISLKPEFSFIGCNMRFCL